jgi:glycerophosphoryl diester phosphodiesterase
MGSKVSELSGDTPLWERKLVIGHRGAAAHEPENTLLSFRKAIEMGADMVELDVHETVDGKLVCVHDYDLARLCDCKRLISDMTYDEVLEFDVGGGQHVPLLRDVLQLMKGKAGVNIEIKVPDIETGLAHLIAHYDMSSDIVVSSFIHETLVRFRKSDPHTRTGVLFNEPLDDATSYATELGAASLHPLFFTIDSEFVKQAHEADLLVYPWTVNDEEMMLELWNLGVDGIITDCPDVGVRTRMEFMTRE